MTYWLARFHSAETHVPFTIDTAVTGLQLLLTLCIFPGKQLSIIIIIVSILSEQGKVMPYGFEDHSEAGLKGQVLFFLSVGSACPDYHLGPNDCSRCKNKGNRTDDIQTGKVPYQRCGKKMSVHIKYFPFFNTVPLWISKCYFFPVLTKTNAEITKLYKQEQS